MAIYVDNGLNNDVSLLRRRNLSDPMLTFIDGTPDYLHLPTSACRISKAFPNAKLIIVLRDPVMRALSQWNMLRVMQGRERVSNFDLEVLRLRELFPISV